MRSATGLDCTSRHNPALVGSYGLRQKFINLHCLQQNGVFERVIRARRSRAVAAIAPRAFNTPRKPWQSGSSSTTFADFIGRLPYENLSR